MNTVFIFDLTVGVLLVIFGIKGLFNGFIKEVFGLIGIIGGIFIASRFASQAGALIDEKIYHIDNRASVYFIGFLVILLLFWMASLLIGLIFTKLISLSGLGLLNRIFGFLVGSLKIFLLFSIVIFALRSIDIFKSNIDKRLDGSFIYPYLIKSGDYIVKLNFNNTNKMVKDIQKKMATESNNTKTNK